MKLQSYHTDFIKNKAIDLGFISCGISKSGFLNDEVNRFEKWLKNNYHGKMSYMERNFDKRMDRTKLVEGSKSVISLLYKPNTKTAKKGAKLLKICTLGGLFSIYIGTI